MSDFHKNNCLVHVVIKECYLAARVHGTPPLGYKLVIC